MKKRISCLCLIVLLLIISVLSIYAEPSSELNTEHDNASEESSSWDANFILDGDNAYEDTDSLFGIGDVMFVVAIIIRAVGFLIFVLVIVTIIKIIRRAYRLRQTNRKVAPLPTYKFKGAEGIPSLKNMSEYHNIDPQFSEARIKDELSNVYIKFLNSLQNKNIDDLRAYFTDDFYAQMKRKAEKFKTDKQTYHAENVAIHALYVEGWRQDEYRDIISVKLRVRKNDYITDDITGAIIQGDRTRKSITTYEGEIVRTRGLTTKVSDGLTAQICPNCGGQININHTTKCEYCGAIISAEEFNWAINSVRVLAQSNR